MRAKLVVLGVLCGAASLAAADPDPEAKRLFEEGRALVDQGKTAEACAKFAQSLELERALGTMLNLGECAERTGEFARAWAFYDEAARGYERENRLPSAKFARERADTLAPKLAVVIVRLSEPRLGGLSLRVGEREESPARAVTVRRDPGELVISARAPGRVPFATKVTAAGGAAITVDVPVMARVPRTMPEEPEAEPAPPSRRGWRIALAGSAGAAIVGGILWYYGYSEVRDAERTTCQAPDSTCNLADVPDEVRAEANRQGARGQTFTFVGGGLAIVGVGVAGFSLYKAYLAPDRSGEGARRPRVAPVVAPSLYGIAVAGAF